MHIWGHYGLRSLGKRFYFITAFTALPLGGAEVPRYLYSWYLPVSCHTIITKVCFLILEWQEVLVIATKKNYQTLRKIKFPKISPTNRNHDREHSRAKPGVLRVNLNFNKINLHILSYQKRVLVFNQHWNILILEAHKCYALNWIFLHEIVIFYWNSKIEWLFFAPIFTDRIVVAILIKQKNCFCLHGYFNVDVLKNFLLK